ncbi:hypothetical protein PHYSODRAFT_330008 [Phytophthora sojae]|uniref:Uncharacterized protein n=1 Tax=Phytophthora sojae (strain P6497) TaxID=1094619 RepID=G4ZCC9_PHYSP|nr:hypothetical protein PHYSODRAFT_330008 [Phytophthora sojae]EGZ22157.1 hypothetical protein PHYSODRAFT_330008 [Phytophthora sojae]|eukprot:XP_009524874.1 hypothetical protein PHYSODRAFT_330008 [Phytophthora sojae]
MSGNNAGNANNAGDGAVGTQQQQFRGSSKPPLFEGTFELYQAELELYLGDRDAWEVVTGAVVRHGTDQAEQATFDRRDRLARATILRGLRGCKNDDASKVCGMTTAKEMWDTLVGDHTQRDFSYAMLLKRQLYQCSHTPGQSMAEYIRTMTQLRQ